MGVTDWSHLTRKRKNLLLWIRSWIFDLCKMRGIKVTKELLALKDWPMKLIMARDWIMQEMKGWWTRENAIYNLFNTKRGVKEILGDQVNSAHLKTRSGSAQKVWLQIKALRDGPTATEATYAVWTFISVLKGARHCPLSWARWIQ